MQFISQGLYTVNTTSILRLIKAFLQRLHSKTSAERCTASMELEGKGSPGGTESAAVKPEIRDRLLPFQKCRILWGQEAILLALLVVFTGAVSAVIYFQYTRNFADQKWMFLCILAISAVLLASYFVRTFKAACLKHELLAREQKRLGVRRKQRGVLFSLEFRSWRRGVRAIFSVNGKYYMLNMRVSEIFGQSVQLLNLTTIYLCWLPLEFSSLLCAVQALELLLNLWLANHTDSQLVRDRQLLVHIVADFVYVVLPPSIIYIGFRIPIKVSALVQIIVFPSLSLLSKANAIWNDLFLMKERSMSVNTVCPGQARGHRRRVSILGMIEDKDVTRTQLEHFPRWLRNVFSAINGTFLLIFMFLPVLQLATRPADEACANRYSSEVWKGCRVPVPFCQNIFVPHCDCAVLTMGNYSQPSLPDSFTGMKSLIVLTVVKGNLTKLPTRMGQQHPSVVSLYVYGTKLAELPDSIGDMKELFDLYIPNNELTTLPESVAKLPNLANLMVFNNELTSVPDYAGAFDRLLQLDVSNNRLNRLPGNMLLLEWLHAWNNTLESFPDGLISLTKVDVRHNRINALPIENWEQIEYFYAAGNPLCPYKFPSGVQGRCQAQCSPDCPSHRIRNQMCDDMDYAYIDLFEVQPKRAGCNVRECDFDGGDCSW